MTVAVIGAGLHFALPSSSTKAPSTQGPGRDLTALVTQVQAGMRQPELTKREEHILNVASGPWQGEPFRDRLPTPVVEKPESMEQPVKLPTYTAFMVVGARTLAIIDGLEYRKEESIKGGEFRVAEIYPDRVELIRQGAVDPVLIQLAEEQSK